MADRDGHRSAMRAPTGYYDEFRADGCFYYTGAGKYGDHSLRDANLALLNHKPHGRRVHLFSGAGGEAEFKGVRKLPNMNTARYPRSDE
jgi:hypothetical protein